MKILVTGAAGYIGGTFCWNATKNISQMCQDAWDAVIKFKGV